jgi:hypothetical protein
MARGTTQSTAKDFVRKAAQSRPATDGNKNLQSTARRKSADSQVPASLTKPLVGPDKGTG